MASINCEEMTEFEMNFVEGLRNEGEGEDNISFDNREDSEAASKKLDISAKISALTDNNRTGDI